MKKKCREILLMRMPIKVRLLTRLQDVKNEMESYPNYKLERIGTILRYKVLGTRKFGVDYIVELGKSHIVLEVGSTDSPLYETRNSLNILLGICAVLMRHYEVDFGSIYPYLAYQLNREQIDYCDKQVQQSGKENYSDIILARRINELLIENDNLRVRTGVLEGSFRGLIVKVLVLEGLHRTISVSEISSKYHLSKEWIDEGIGSLIESGYRVKRNNPDKFLVVSV